MIEPIWLLDSIITVKTAPDTCRLATIGYSTFHEALELHSPVDAV